MGRVLNDTWGPVDITTGANAVYNYTVTTAGTYRIQVFLDSVAGGATDYIAWLQKQRLGVGVSYPILPRTTGTGIAGWTELAFTTISVDAVATDVLSIYIDGQPADNAVSGKIEIFADHTLAEIATAVWASGTRTLTSFGTLVADIVTAVCASDCITGLASSIITLLQNYGVLKKACADYEIYRGDTWTKRISGLGDLTGNTDIWFGIKADKKSDLDASAIVLISRTVGLERINGAAATVAANGSITVVGAATNGVIDVVLDEVETAKLIPDKYSWDVQKLVGGVVTSPKCGNITVTADVVRATS